MMSTGSCEWGRSQVWSEIGNLLVGRLVGPGVELAGRLDEREVAIEVIEAARGDDVHGIVRVGQVPGVAEFM
jgi:hypothetical protein